MKPFAASAVLAACLASGTLYAQVAETPDPVGNALRFAVPLGAVALALHREDADGLKEFGWTLLASQGTTEVLKHAVRSPRPNGAGYGFPSSHVSAVFAAAGFVHRRYGMDEAWPFYALAALTAYERVRHHHHFTKDVVGGAVVGVGSAFLLTHPLPDGGTLALGLRAGGLWLGYARRW